MIGYQDNSTNNGSWVTCPITATSGWNSCQILSILWDYTFFQEFEVYCSWVPLWLFLNYYSSCYCHAACNIASGFYCTMMELVGYCIMTWFYMRITIVSNSKTFTVSKYSNTLCIQYVHIYQLNNEFGWPNMTHHLDSRLQMNKWIANKPGTSADPINSLLASDILWWQSQHRSGSTVAQVMAFCLTTPSHYLKQSCVMGHSPGTNFTSTYELNP